MPRQYPFTAVVGSDDMALALVLATISPSIGGVLVRGEKGTAKSTLVRALTQILPPIDVIAGDRFSTDPAQSDPTSPDGTFGPDAPVKTRAVRLVELPVGATEDRVAGSIDLKRALGSVSDEDWASIPEVGDLTGKNRRSKQNMRQRFYAVPDSVLAGASTSGQLGTEVQEDGMATEGAGSSEQADGTMTNFADIGAARDKVLKVRLDQAAQTQQGTESVSGTSTNIDPKGYLTKSTSNVVVHVVVELEAVLTGSKIEHHKKASVDSVQKG